MFGVKFWCVIGVIIPTSGASIFIKHCSDNPAPPKMWHERLLQIAWSRQDMGTFATNFHVTILWQLCTLQYQGKLNFAAAGNRLLSSLPSLPSCLFIRLFLLNEGWKCLLEGRKEDGRRPLSNCLARRRSSIYLAEYACPTPLRELRSVNCFCHSALKRSNEMLSSLWCQFCACFIRTMCSQWVADETRFGAGRDIKREIERG